MRLSNAQAVARPSPYDRNGLTKTQYVATGNLAPHAPVTRWTYTVPAGKKAFFDVVYAYAQRAAAAAPVGVASVLIDYTPASGVASRVAQVFQITNAVNDVQQTQITQFGIMEAGDILTATDLDTSTGGTVAFVETAKYTEFDA